MRTFLFFALLVAGSTAGLLSCTKDVAIAPNPYAPKVSIECVLVPDSLPKLYLTRSRSYLGTDVNTLRDAIPGASVVITEDDVPGRSVYQDDATHGQEMSIVIEPATKHARGDVGTIRPQTLDPASACFFDQLDRQKLALPTPFVEPMFLKTEIPGAIGVFGAVNQSAPVLFTFPE